MNNKATERAGSRVTAANARDGSGSGVRGSGATQPGPKSVRCAVYTRKSSEEGLSQEFNSLDAQRESAIAYIASQKQEGWVCLPEKYDDGGFTGGNIERPGLRRLMVDIEAGRIDCVVVYKVDRLSRSLMDFARLMELFDRKGVSFVSVTQQFNTSHSMGRLTLNVLLSFAQFEREIISERTRDKIAAARRKGKYAVGKPLLGYDYVPAPPPFTGRKLMVNAAEAERVRRIFELYLETKSLLRVAEECNARGWRTKGWTTSAGRVVGGRLFDKTIVSRLLRNPLYAGKVPHKGNVYAGEHEAIVTGEVFDRVQRQLRLGAMNGGMVVRAGGSGALLKGLLRCKACGCAMSPSSACKTKPDGTRVRYRYYVCSNAVKRGRRKCPSPSLPVVAIERFVLERVKAVLLTRMPLAPVIERAVELLRASAQERVEERAQLGGTLERLKGRPPTAESRREIERLERTLTALDARIAADERRLIDEDEIAGVIETFDSVWEAMSAGERAELLGVLIREVEYDESAQEATVVFRPLEGAEPVEAVA